MKIYIDVLIITNIILNALFIKCISRLTHSKISGKRAGAASVFGGAGALIALLIPESRIEALLLTAARLIISLITVRLAFKIKKAEELLKYFFMYIAANFMFAGLCIILWKNGSSGIIYINALTVYIDIPLPWLLGAAVVTYLLLGIYEYLQRKSFSPSKRYRIIIKIENLEYCLPAVADTGNTLTDIFSGLPVVIICCNELYYHFSLDCEEIALGAGFHLIPYSTIHGDGTLNVTRNAAVRLIDSDRQEKELECCIAITKSTGQGERAIFNPSLAL